MENIVCNVRVCALIVFFYERRISNNLMTQMYFHERTVSKWPFRHITVDVVATSQKKRHIIKKNKLIVFSRAKDKQRVTHYPNRNYYALVKNKRGYSLLAVDSQ